MNQRRQNKRVPESGQEWGVLGGAFDPIHNGHINLAQQLHQLRGFNGVLLVPSGTPQHRDPAALAPFSTRLAMTRLAIAEFTWCSASDIEQRRRLSGYTIDLMEALNLEFPGVGWTLIVGADQGAVFDSWREPARLLKLCRVVVGARPGYEPVIPYIEGREQIEVAPITEVDLSSSAIRRRISDGATKSDLVSMVPPAVAQYILDHGLYRS